MNLEEPEIVSTKWKCLKCHKVSPAIGIQIELSHRYLKPELIAEFEEIPMRRYCFYCWVKFFDEHVGRVEKVSE